MTLKERSGDVVTHSNLVSFLYELMRDHLVPGAVAAIVERSQHSALHMSTSFTNGWLARYAMDIAERLDNRQDVLAKESCTVRVWRGGHPMGTYCGQEMTVEENSDGIIIRLKP